MIVTSQILRHKFLKGYKRKSSFKLVGLSFDFDQIDLAPLSDWSSQKIIKYNKQLSFEIILSIEKW